MGERAFSDMLSGYSLTTAEILYRMPDHPALLQSFIWQDYDLFPVLAERRHLPATAGPAPPTSMTRAASGAVDSRLSAPTSQERRGR